MWSSKQKVWSFLWKATQSHHKSPLTKVKPRGNTLLEICIPHIRISKISGWYQRYNIRISRENWPNSNYISDRIQKNVKNICWIHLNIIQISVDNGQRLKNMKSRWKQPCFYWIQQLDVKDINRMSAGYQGLCIPDIMSCHPLFCKVWRMPFGVQNLLRWLMLNEEASPCGLPKFLSSLGREDTGFLVGSVSVGKMTRLSPSVGRWVMGRTHGTSEDSGDSLSWLIRRDVLKFDPEYLRKLSDRARRPKSKDGRRL